MRQSKSIDFYLYVTPGAQRVQVIIMAHLEGEDDVWCKVKAQFLLAVRYEALIKQTIAQHTRAVQLLNRTSVAAILYRISAVFAKSDWTAAECILKATFVYIVRNHQPQMSTRDVEELVCVFPEFSGATEPELVRLVEMRNTLVAALVIFDPKYRGRDILSLVRLICGIDHSDSYDEFCLELMMSREMQAPSKMVPAPLGPKRPALVIVESDSDDHARKKFKHQRTAVSLSAQDFWRNRCEHMEAGTDIPFVTAPGDHPYTCFTYPLRDAIFPSWIPSSQCGSNSLVSFNQAAAACIWTGNTTTTPQLGAYVSSIYLHNTPPT